MFNLFKKKSKEEVLNKQYWKLMSEAHRLSTVNRRESDKKIAEADRLIGEIEAIQSV